MDDNNINTEKTESEMSLTDNESIYSEISSEDFRDVSLADAYEDQLEEIIWPSETYKEFMIAVTQHRLSDAAADSMLRIIRKYCTVPLPSSTRKGQTYIDKLDVKGLHIKSKDLIEFEGETYKLQYRSILDAIKSIISNSDLTKYFLFDYDEKRELGNVSYNLFVLTIYGMRNQ